MASCDASDVQLKAQSPLYRRAREARKDAGKDDYCEAREKKLEPCPPGLCRCSGQLRKKVETVDHPWGAPHQTLPKHDPPDWDATRLAAEAAKALQARGNMRAAVQPKLDALIQEMTAHAAVLAADEQERLAELVEWRALL